MYAINYSIDKQTIEDKISQEEIMAYYLNLLGSKLDYNKPILSPLRDERSPSFTCKKRGSRIAWRDWGTGMHGDAYAFVQAFYSCDFYSALKHINEDMVLGLEKESLDMIMKKVETPREKRKEIFLEKQSFSLSDYNYWRQFGIGIRTLLEYSVFSVKYVWINETLVKIYRSGNPVYAYVFSDGVKIYCPNEDKKRKWLTTTKRNTIEGGSQLPVFGHLLIITKSLKDVMTLRELGYNAVSFSSENTTPDNKIVDELIRRFDRTVLFYDNDKPGKIAANNAAERYSIQQKIFIQNNYAKDISDFVKNFGQENAKTFLKASL